MDRSAFDEEGVVDGEPLIRVLQYDVIPAALLPAHATELGVDPRLGEQHQVRPIQKAARGHVPTTADELGGEVEMGHVRDACHQHGGFAPIGCQRCREPGQLAEHCEGVRQVLDDVEQQHGTDRTPLDDVCELDGEPITHGEVDHMTL